MICVTNTTFNISEMEYFSTFSDNAVDQQKKKNWQKFAKMSTVMVSQGLSQTVYLLNNNIKLLLKNLHLSFWMMAIGLMASPWWWPKLLTMCFCNSHSIQNPTERPVARKRTLLWPLKHLAFKTMDRVSFILLQVLWNDWLSLNYQYV